MSHYRRCAGIIVFNSDKKVLVCARKGMQGNQWQFPQGGIMEKETVLAAAIRELTEETSIRSVVPVKTLKIPLRYTFPDSVRRRMLQKGINNLGQDMYWSLLYFFGEDSEINLHTQQPEFKAWEWIEIDEAVDRIVCFKKEVYKQAVCLLKPEMESFGRAKPADVLLTAKI